MVELKKKITKIGNGYGILLPKALVECKVFDLGEEVNVKLDKLVDWSDESQTLKAKAKSGHVSQEKSP